MWPACVPHCVARIHARMHACVGAWVRPARPHLGAACVCSDCRLPIPGRPCACLPRLPARLPPLPPVSPERGGASCPPPANRLSSWERVATSWESVAPNLAPQPGFLQRRRRARSLPSPCARLPRLGPRMSPQAPPTRSRSLVKPGLAQGVGFFSGSAYTSPLVALRKYYFNQLAVPKLCL